MLNKVMLIGNVGRDPEVRYTQRGDAVANFSIATSENWKDKGGQRQEKTEWHNLVAFRQRADFVQQYIKKGSKIYVEGKLQTRDWTDNQSVKHYRTEVVVDNIQFVGPPPDGQSRGRAQPEGGYETQSGDPGYQGEQGDQGNQGRQGGSPPGRGGQSGQGGGQGGAPSNRGGNRPPPNQTRDPGPPDEEPYMEDDIPF